MRELKKQWARAAPSGSGLRWILKDKDERWNWAVIYRNPIRDTWELQIWDGNDWGNHIHISTLRAAKSIGRILAAAAANI